MNKQQLLQHLQDIEWDNFEVKTAKTDVPKDESLPRNPVLAKFFRIAKLCESAGYGFDKMLEWKNQTGNEVLFETNVYKTKFTFWVDENTYKESIERAENSIKSQRKQPENCTENYSINVRKSIYNKGANF